MDLPRYLEQIRPISAPEHREPNTCWILFYPLKTDPLKSSCPKLPSQTFTLASTDARTTISLDPDLFRALTFKLGGTELARNWLHDKANAMPEGTKRVSQKLQAKISLLLAGLESDSGQPQACSADSAHPTPAQSTSFKSDDIPL